jgi:hypothetical protein
LELVGKVLSAETVLSLSVSRGLVAEEGDRNRAPGDEGGNCRDWKREVGQYESGERDEEGAEGEARRDELEVRLESQLRTVAAPSERDMKARRIQTTEKQRAAMGRPDKGKERQGVSFCRPESSSLFL